MNEKNNLKWYHPIPCDNTVKNPLVCDYSNLEDNGYDKWSFLTGEQSKSWNQEYFLQAKKKKNDGKPDDVLQNYLMLPIYSERLIQELVKENIQGIQYLPIHVLRPNNESLTGFAIANLLNFFDALDHNLSNYTRFSDDFPNPNVRGQIAGITKFVLKKDKLLGIDMFRLKEYEQSIFVSEKFKDLFERNKFTGYSFEEVELT
jgi:hypothetical protein